MLVFPAHNSIQEVTLIPVRHWWDPWKEGNLQAVKETVGAISSAPCCKFRPPCFFNRVTPWTPHLTPLPPVNSQARVIFVGRSATTSLLIKTLPWFPGPHEESSITWQSLCLGPGQSGPPTSLSSFRLMLKVSTCLHKVQWQLASPLPGLLPHSPCSLLKLASLLYLQQVQPAPNSGPLHMTVSLPGPINVSLESPMFPPSLPAGSVPMSLIREAFPDRPISNNTPSPNHKPYIPYFALVFPIVFLATWHMTSTSVYCLSSHARIEASRPICSLHYQCTEQRLA